MTATAYYVSPKTMTATTTYSRRWWLLPRLLPRALTYHDDGYYDANDGTASAPVVLGVGLRSPHASTTTSQ